MPNMVRVCYSFKAHGVVCGGGHVRWGMCGWRLGGWYVGIHTPYVHIFIMAFLALGRRNAAATAAARDIHHRPRLFHLGVCAHAPQRRSCRARRAAEDKQRMQDHLCANQMRHQEAKALRKEAVAKNKKMKKASTGAPEDA